MAYDTHSVFRERWYDQGQADNRVAPEIEPVIGWLCAPQSLPWWLGSQTVERSTFTVEHGLSCKKGGFVGQRHDDVCEELAHLCSMALTPSQISSGPEIFYGRELNVAQRTEGEVLGDEARGDVGAHGFWKRGRTTIFDIMICDTDAKSYGNHTSKKVLESTVLRKKSKYEEACLERRQDFTPMIYSFNGMVDKHACAAEKRIAGIFRS